MKKLIITYLALVVSFFISHAQIFDPVAWDNSIEFTSDTSATISFKATIERGWHMYSTDIPDGGPQKTSINFTSLTGCTPIGDLTADSEPIREFDPTFDMTLAWWTKNVTLTQKLHVADKDSFSVNGEICYAACNDNTCTPPSKNPFSFSDTPGLPAGMLSDSPGENEGVQSSGIDSPLWLPVESEAETLPITGWHDLLYILIGGFIGGLIALFTPCVWPMIPLTVSFFLKKSGNNKKAVTDAMIYGCSIIVIYLLLGLIITSILGASALNALSTNAILNIIFFLLLVVFAISFFGAFEITLPSSWSTKLDNKAGKTSGLISIFFMAFTLALVSFSCTGPIIGTLLVEAATMGNKIGPAIGMAGFAIALAIPFTLFAIFPSWLKELPKSGGWMNTVKVTLGFLELALSLKFLSVADLAYGWGILDRETFLALWIVIFLLLGLYLLGIFKFKSDNTTGSIGVFRFFIALVSLAFSVYLIPGLWGAPLKSVSAFVPPLYTQDFNLYTAPHGEEFDDYDKAMAESSKTGKPVLLDFSGYGCVNCRKMEAAVFDNSRIRTLIADNFILARLMVDDRTSLPSPIKVKENGKDVTLSTVGEKWSYLQRHKFGANSQPYYIILSAEGKVLSGPTYYDESVDKFAAFLDKALSNNQ